MQSWSNGQLFAVPSHEVLDELDDLGLTLADLQARVHYVDSAGVVTGGAEAMNEAAKTVSWLRPLALLYRFAPIARIEDRIYVWIAANRHRMPGGTSACEMDPEP